jgi:hypothetical protein
MTQYLLAVQMVEGAPTPPTEEIQQMFAAVDLFNQEVQSAGAWVFAGGLHPPTVATVVRAKDGEVLITDGPFAETKEALAGYYILECPNLDEAIEWAAKIPTMCKGGAGCIEIRPMPGLPKRKPEPVGEHAVGEHAGSRS